MKSINPVYKEGVSFKPFSSPNLQSTFNPLNIISAIITKTKTKTKQIFLKYPVVIVN